MAYPAAAPPPAYSTPGRPASPATPNASAAARSRQSASRSASARTGQAGRAASLAAAIRSAKGKYPQQRATSVAASGSAPTRSWPASRASKSSASTWSKAFRCRWVALSKAERIRRLVTRTPQPGLVGSNGATCAAPAALSSTTSRCRPTTRERNAALASSRPAGTAAGSVPSVRRKPPSTRAVAFTALPWPRAMPREGWSQGAGRVRGAGAGDVMEQYGGHDRPEGAAAPRGDALSRSSGGFIRASRRAGYLAMDLSLA
jgi:hypothetical protein